MALPRPTDVLVGMRRKLRPSQLRRENDVFFPAWTRRNMFLGIEPRGQRRWVVIAGPIGEARVMASNDVGDQAAQLSVRLLCNAGSGRRVVDAQSLAVK